MSAKLMEYFNKNPRLGTLSTSSKDGKVNVACFGSPHMVDEKTVVISTAKNRPSPIFRRIRSQCI